MLWVQKLYLSTKGKGICVNLIVIYVCTYLFVYLYPPPCKENVRGQRGEYMKIAEFIRRKILFSFLKTGNTEDAWSERWSMHTKSQGQDRWDQRCGKTRNCRAKVPQIKIRWQASGSAWLQGHFGLWKKLIIFSSPKFYPQEEKVTKD